jgi:hypothetical protein
MGEIHRLFHRHKWIYSGETFDGRPVYQCKSPSCSATKISRAKSGIASVTEDVMQFIEVRYDGKGIMPFQNPIDIFNFNEEINDIPDGATRPLFTGIHISNHANIAVTVASVAVEGFLVGAYLQKDGDFNKLMLTLSPLGDSCVIEKGALIASVGIITHAFVPVRFAVKNPQGIRAVVGKPSEIDKA